MRRPGGVRAGLLGQLFSNLSSMTGLSIVLPLGAIAILAPVLSNERPLYARLDGRAVFPALGEAPLIGALFERAEFSRIDWKSLSHQTDVIRAPVPYHYASTDMTHRYSPPNADHLLGTDGLGRDILARMIHGTRVSMGVALAATIVALLIALIVGSVGGYYGGWVDSILSRLIETVICFPTLFLVLALMGLDPPFLRRFSDLQRIMLVIGLTGWTGLARYVRAEFLRLKPIDFVTSARAVGAGDARILLTHIFPNALGPVLVAAAFFMANAIILEAAISFLGFGIRPPAPSWGSMLSEAPEAVTQAWWLALFPGGALFAVVLGTNLMGEGLRQILDPRRVY